MAEKAEVLKAHNDLRSQVAQGRLPGFPAARNMYRMKWDDDLAQVAQAFTNLCDDRHDKEAQRKTSKFPKVGQNIAWNYEPTQTQVVDSAGRVKDWFSEYKDFSAAYVDPFHVNPGPVVTHFTQVAWADTRYIGCGYTHYKLRNDDNPSLPYKKLFVCNYAPGGNVIGRSMYKVGSVCSVCPAGTVCDAATGLCYTPGESDGLDDSAGRTGSQWGILAFFLLGIFATAAVAVGLLYVRSTILRPPHPAQQQCAM